MSAPRRLTPSQLRKASGGKRPVAKSNNKSKVLTPEQKERKERNQKILSQIFAKQKQDSEKKTQSKYKTKKGKMPSKLLESFKSKSATSKGKSKPSGEKKEESKTSKLKLKFATSKAEPKMTPAERKDKAREARLAALKDRPKKKTSPPPKGASKNITYFCNGRRQGTPCKKSTGGSAKKKAVARDKGLAKGEAKVTKDVDRLRKTTAPKQVQPTKGIKHVGQERTADKKVKSRFGKGNISTVRNSQPTDRDAYSKYLGDKMKAKKKK